MSSILQTLNEYQAMALRTSGRPLDEEKALAVMALGVAGEAGEVADYLKKVIGHGHKLDVDKIKKELGDVLWYIAVLSDLVDLTLSEVANANVEKLRQRYPDGFSSERSINRPEES